MKDGCNNMKKILTLLLSVLVLSSCNNTSTKVTLKEAPNRQEVNYKIIESKGYQNFINKLKEFSTSISANYYKHFKDEENIVVSPLSIYMALAMTTSCSDGQTNKELTNMLGLTNEQIFQYTKILYDYETKIEYGEDKNKTILTEGFLTNSIWFDERMNKGLIDSGLETLANDFYASSFEVDFDGQNKKANKLIQDYVAENTKNKINQNFNIPPATALALMNTYYLKDSWNGYDIEGLSLTDKEYEFNNKTSTKLLKGTYQSGKCLQEEDYQSFYIKTISNNKLYFIVPNEDKDISEVFNYENILKTISYQYVTSDKTLQERYYTRCLFPSFSLSSDKHLKTIFMDEYNIPSLFSPRECNLEKIYKGENNLYVDDIIHVAKLDVDKKGLEGAAVTIVTTVESTAPMPDPMKDIYYDFYVTKTFGVVLTDGYNVPLFSGIVNNINKS